jgi:ribose 1,5-bisphosphokinase
MATIRIKYLNTVDQSDRNDRRGARRLPFTLDQNALSQAETQTAPLPSRAVNGALVLVVGPSGAGKDSIQSYARAQLAGDHRFVFARRLITRAEADPSEDHEACDARTFTAEEAAGNLALSWRAHSTAYGIRRAILDDLACGRIVIANVSRGVIGAGSALAPRVVVVHITAQPAVLAARLQQRGRETADEILARLAREAPLPPTDARLVVISNDGPITEGGTAFLTLLRELAAQSQTSGQRHLDQNAEPRL